MKLLVVLGIIVDVAGAVLAVLLWRLARSIEQLNAASERQGANLERISDEAGEAYGRLVEALDRAEGRWTTPADPAVKETKR